MTEYKVTVEITVGNGIDNMAGPNMEQACKQVRETLDEEQQHWPDMFGFEITEAQAIPGENDDK